MPLKLYIYYFFTHMGPKGNKKANKFNFRARILRSVTRYAQRRYAALNG